MNALLVGAEPRLIAVSFQHLFGRRTTHSRDSPIMATSSENMTLDAYGFGYSFKTFLLQIRITAVKLDISSQIHKKIPMRVQK